VAAKAASSRVMSSRIRPALAATCVCEGGGVREETAAWQSAWCGVIAYVPELSQGMDLHHLCC
jgi:hypothetical protein